MSFTRYQSHKVVEAFRIEAIQPLPDGTTQLTGARSLETVVVDAAYMSKHGPQVGGYFVLYPDGYQSWSPAEAFESGYTQLPEGS